MGEHRVVFFDIAGPGPHSCTHCERKLEPDELKVDHKNHNRSDNRPENLQASCHRCNTKRGRSGARIWERYDREAYERDGTVKPL